MNLMASVTSFHRTKSSQNLGTDERKTVLVLGGAGMVGGALARALLSYACFNVKVGTRRPWSTEATLLRQAGCVVVEVDYYYKYSLVLAMQEVTCVFLHTHYWENYSCLLEFQQGKNAVEAAVEAGVKHLIYDGTNYVTPSNGRLCSFLLSRLQIQDFIAKSGISYTIIVLPFYFENFLSVFRPHEVSPDLFAIPLPMEGLSIPCGCLSDIALCICKVILNSASYVKQSVFLVTELLTVAQMASVFTSTQTGQHFFDPELAVEDFMEFEFPGAKDLAAMFEFYQQMEDIPDLSLAKSLNPQVRQMHDWASDNRAQISMALADTQPQTRENFIFPYRLRRSKEDMVATVSATSSDFQVHCWTQTAERAGHDSLLTVAADEATDLRPRSRSKSVQSTDKPHRK